MYLVGLQCTASYTDFKNLPFDPPTEYQKNMNQAQPETNCALLYFITKLYSIAKYTVDLLIIQLLDMYLPKTAVGTPTTNHPEISNSTEEHRAPQKFKTYLSSCNTQTTHTVE